VEAAEVVGGDPGRQAGGDLAVVRRSPLDLAVFSTVAGVFILTGLAACLVPAMRASVINPLEALKCE